MKKRISVILSVLIAVSSVVIFPVFAAEKGYEKGRTVKLEFRIDEITQPFTGFEGSLSFSDKLTINKESVTFPHIAGINYSVGEGNVPFNATSLSNFDISSDKVFMKAEFTFNEESESLPVKCVLDDIYIIENKKDFVVPDNIELPYTLSVYEVESEQASTSEFTSETQPTTAATEPATAHIEPTEPNVKPEKKNNPIKLKAKTKTVKAKKLIKKSKIIKPVTVKNAKGKVTYKKLKKGSTAKLFKNVTVGRTSGRIKIKKGVYKKKTYKLSLSVNAKGNSLYKPKTQTLKLKIRIK